jgi:hypothetical protein
MVFALAQQRTATVTARSGGAAGSSGRRRKAGPSAPRAQAPRKSGKAEDALAFAEGSLGAGAAVLDAPPPSKAPSPAVNVIQPISRCAPSRTAGCGPPDRALSTPLARPKPEPDAPA